MEEKQNLVLSCKEKEDVKPCLLGRVMKPQCQAESDTLTSGQLVNTSEKPEADITVTRPVTQSARPSVGPKHPNSHSM